MVLLTAIVPSSSAQIVTIRPDRAAPGMNVLVELLFPKHAQPIGYDTLASGNSITVLHPSDTNRIVVGPSITSWNGHLLQIPLFILPEATLGTVPMILFDSVTAVLDTFEFTIDTPQHLGSITHDTTIGESFGSLSQENVILVDSLIATNARVHFSLSNPDTSVSNPRLLPVVILSKGPVRLTHSVISVDADSLDGGPGGGGGGHGFGGSGGIGFTGGGSCPGDSLGNAGSDSLPTLTNGGRAATGIVGGESDPFNGGGGGGTGEPYGESGFACLADVPSPIGGYGGGSGGGQDPNTEFVYGGGGGGFGTDGEGGIQTFGTSGNGGQKSGGRFLVPLMGGSGGGAGNSIDLGDTTYGGSGGGGGGAIELVAFDSIVFLQSTISARGDSGRTGSGHAAGGGGGSGGAIVLESSSGTREVASNLLINGGLAGRAADSMGFNGGIGGFGRVSIDGPSNIPVQVQDSSVWIRGVSANGNASSATNDSIVISGSLQDVQNTTGRIRLLFRTWHSAWHVTDTVRTAAGTWSKILPMFHDSILFVVTFAEVKDPASSFTQFDYEPSWITSCAGMQVYRAPAEPFLVSTDSLGFGSVRVGRCKTLPLVIHNEGAAPLIINKNSIEGLPDFSVLETLPDTLKPYSIDTLHAQYCPTITTAVRDTLIILSNDSENSPKAIVLVGTGFALHDSLLVQPNSILFDRVVVGTCQSDTVILRSVGTDTLDLLAREWNDSPFTLRLIPPDTALAKGQHDSLVITFCPMDTSIYTIAPVLDGREDSIRIEGHGILRQLQSRGTVPLGEQCLGRSISLTDSLFNIGNDTITILGWEVHSSEGIRAMSGTLSILMQPHETVPMGIAWPIDSVGIFTDTIEYFYAGGVSRTLVTYTVNGPQLRFDSTIELSFVCVGASDTDSVLISNLGTDSVDLSSFELSPSRFALLDSAAGTAPNGSLILHLRFSPQDTVLVRDTLRISASTQGCGSTISIALVARGIVTGLAAHDRDFGRIALGTCTIDSVTVDNPCGPEETIDTIRSTNPAFALVSALPISVPSGGSQTIAFRFCPQDTAEVFDTVVFDSKAGMVTSVLRGSGLSNGDARAAFSLSDTAIRADSIAIVRIMLDSASLVGRHGTRIAISFDPAVIALIEGFPFPIERDAADTISFSDTINFGMATGTIESIEWRGLLGPRASSSIGVRLTSDTLIHTTVIPGMVTITDCTGLNGQFSVAGAYVLGQLTPNPASSVAEAKLTLGNDGPVQAAIYDMTGKPVATIISGWMDRGDYQIELPIGSLASGGYILEVRSVGWAASEPLMVHR